MRQFLIHEHQRSLISFKYVLMPSSSIHSHYYLFPPLPKSIDHSLTSPDLSQTEDQKDGNSGPEPPPSSCTVITKSEKPTRHASNKKCRNVKSDMHWHHWCRPRRIASIWNVNWLIWGGRRKLWRMWRIWRGIRGCLVLVNILVGSGCQGRCRILWGIRDRGGIERLVGWLLVYLWIEIVGKLNCQL